jgi:hypothetical protein
MVGIRERNAYGERDSDRGNPVDCKGFTAHNIRTTAYYDVVQDRKFLVASEPQVSFFSL